MRGEYQILKTLKAEYLGSPPHAWRIPKVLRYGRPSLGITSTCVENTEVSLVKANKLQDHLHMRGEYISLITLKKVNLGSPPHAWRILNVPTQGGYYKGITSTCVENTLPSDIPTYPGRDHLHMRGEYFLLSVSCFS